MDVSLFLAKVFGLYFVIVGFLYFYRKDLLTAVMQDYYKHQALVVVTAVFTLILGILLVISHSVWAFNWKMIITLMGYLTLLKGIMNLYFPEVGEKLVAKMIKKDLFTYTGTIVFLLGVYLLYNGFF